MTTASQRKASAKYDKAHTRSILFKFNMTTDADILAKLDDVENRQGYIKELIRNDICGQSGMLSIGALRFMILPAMRKYGVQSAALFGSYARGEATPDSDVDLLIECDQLRNMEDYLNLQEALSKATGKKVDIVLKEALRADKTRAAQRLKEHIEKEKVTVYERTE